MYFHTPWGVHDHLRSLRTCVRSRPLRRSSHSLINRPRKKIRETPTPLILRRSQPSCGFDAHATSATESWTCLSELPWGWESLNIFPGAVTAAAPGAVAAAAPTGRFQQVSLWAASSNYELSIRLSGPQPLLPPPPPSGSSSARRLSFGRSCLSEGVNGTTPLPENEQHTPPTTSRCPNILVVAYVSSFLSYGVMLNEYGDATSVCSPSLYGMGVLSIHV